jgi:hypothetical protein
MWNVIFSYGISRAFTSAYQNLRLYGNERIMIMRQQRILQALKRRFCLLFLASGLACGLNFAAAASQKNDRVPDLIRAIRDGQDKKADKLIKGNKGINARDSYGWTPLMYAIFRGDSGLVERLLSQGADANLQDQDGVTPLIAAIMHMPLPFMVQYLTESERRAKDIPLMLLEKGADPNGGDNDGNTPLIYAAVRDQEAVTEALIKKGADPNRPDRYGRTALYFVNNSDRAKEWAPADGTLSSRYRMRRQSDEFNFSFQYAAQVAEAREQAAVMLKQIRARSAKLLKNAGATVPDSIAIQAPKNRIDSAPQRLGIGPGDPLNKILMNYCQRTRETVRYIMLVCIAPDGTVKEVLVLQGINGISEQLQKAALKLKFQPAIKDGHPVEIWDTVRGFARRTDRVLP